MNDFLFNILIGELDIEDRIEFMEKCNRLLLNDEIFIKDNFKVKNMDLTFNLLTSLCTYYINNSVKRNPKISQRLKKINLKRIYFLVVKELTENEKKVNKVLIDNLYKDYYEICEKCNWNEEFIRYSRRKSRIIENVSNDKFTYSEIVILNETTTEQIIEYGYFYAKSILKKDRSKKIREIMNDRLYILFDMIIKKKNNKQIIEYLNINYQNIEINELKAKLPKFLKYYSIVEDISDDKELDKIKNILEFEIDNKFTKILKKVKNNSESKQGNNEKVLTKEIIIEKSYKNLNLFLEGKYRSIKQFCREMHISISTFKEYISTIETIDKELYDRVAEQIKMQTSIRKANVNDGLLKIVYYIENGIELEDDTIKEFDLLDCYELTGISLINIRCLLNRSGLSEEELKIIRDFLNKYRNCKNISENAIYMERNIVIIDNQNYEVSDIEKRRAIEYLKANNIPLLNVTYNLALKKILNGNLKKTTKKLQLHNFSE